MPLRETVCEALLDTVIVSGLEYVSEVLEEERAALCGPRYQHDPRRGASRAGSVVSSLSLGGRRVEIERPRARSIVLDKFLLRLNCSRCKFQRLQGHYAGGRNRAHSAERY